MEEETPKILKVKEWVEKQREAVIPWSAEAFLKEINQHFNTKHPNIFISKARRQR